MTLRHYRLIGEALVWTLERALGPRLEQATRLAWIDAYEALVDALVDAAADRHLGQAAWDGAFTPRPASAPRPAASARPSRA